MHPAFTLETVESGRIVIKYMYRGIEKISMSEPGYSKFIQDKHINLNTHTHTHTHSLSLFLSFSLALSW